MIPWMTITSLGDMKAMAPIAATIGVGLAMGRSWRMAVCWTLLIAASLFLVAASKIAFIGWCIGSPTLNFTGFSGHAMRVTAIAPVLFYLLLQNFSRDVRLLGVIAGIVCGLIVGVSRLVLHDHSTSEVVAGCILGALVSLSFIFILRSTNTFVLNRWLIAICMMVVVAMPYAEPAPTQRWLVNLTLFISGHTEPCTRADWGPNESAVRPAPLR